MREPKNFLPAAGLRDFILSYGILEFPEGADEPYFSPPIALSGFIIHTVNTRKRIIAKIGDKDQYTDEAVATGQVTRPVHGRNIGRARVLMVFFHPMGMHQLFGNDMSALTNGSMPLTEFLGAAEAHELVASLKADQDDGKQVDVLDRFFSARIPRVSESISRMRKILDFIQSREGGVSVGELEAAGHCQRKTLQRHFKRMVGISPKTFCQIYRFRCLMNLIQAQPGMKWAELTEKAGFYDQSHMSRYIKEYLDVSPSSIVKLDMKLINYLLTR